MSQIRKIGITETLGSGALVWIGIHGKFHLVQWREHSAAQRSWCGKWLQIQLGSTFLLDARPGKHYGNRCAKCESI